MAWNVELTATAEKQLRKLDRKWQEVILDYLEDEIAGLNDPRSRGKGLVGDKKGIWRYRGVLCSPAYVGVRALWAYHRFNIGKLGSRSYFNCHNDSIII